MPTPLESLIQSGTKLWLDSVDPDMIEENFAVGATGATSNPVIISDLIKTGRFDPLIEEMIGAGMDDAGIAWNMADQLVDDAQAVFLPIWEQSRGNDGYVSFEIDPLLEDPELDLPHEQRVARYIELGRQWSDGHDNRMIKIPATPAGIDALEDLCADGVTLNITLIFTADQYRAARDAVWKGARRRDSRDHFKSVYSIFVSRIDVYTQKHVATLSPEAQGLVGIVNAKRIWKENRDFWQRVKPPLEQEIVFASTGTKKPEDSPWKYVEAFAGSDIQTNPPATNEAVARSELTFASKVGRLPAKNVLDEIDAKVDFQVLERVLMEEGIQKFAEPQKDLLRLIGERRRLLSRSTA
jgi:transaldolase